MSLFVDTSAFYAATDAGDQAHARARRLLGAEERYVTTDHVLAESWSLINVRGSHDAAWAIGERFPDQVFSLVDRTSFAVMERLGVHRAVAFDDDFAVYRFGPRGERAFELLR